MSFGREGGNAPRPWAIALLRAPAFARAGALVEVLDDGAALHRTCTSYVAAAVDGLAARAWLARFGEDLEAMHEDPRGILFFPEVLRIAARTYEGVVAEVGGAGVWIARRAISFDEHREQHAAFAGEVRG